MNVTLSYQPQLLSPPFAYAAVLKLTILENKIKAKLDLAYLHRELISIDEIKNEGFTENDDYSWEGELSLNWKQDIELFISMKTKSSPDDEIYLDINVNNSDLGFPSDINWADKLFQELMQAIIEKDGLEMPLTVNLCLIDAHYSITWNFETRTLLINGDMYGTWDDGRAIMETIYDIDFGTVKPMKKATKNSVEIEGQWYPLSDQKVKVLGNQFGIL